MCLWIVNILTDVCRDVIGALICVLFSDMSIAKIIGRRKIDLLRNSEQRVC
jgi:hypothetical protein